MTHAASGFLLFLAKGCDYRQMDNPLSDSIGFSGSIVPNVECTSDVRSLCPSKALGSIVSIIYNESIVPNVSIGIMFCGTSYILYSSTQYRSLDPLYTLCTCTFQRKQTFKEVYLGICLNYEVISNNRTQPIIHYSTIPRHDKVHITVVIGHESCHYPMIEKQKL